MADVHKLEVVQSDKPKPSEDIIRIIRELLREAKEGKIQGIAAALVIYDESSTEKKISTENAIKSVDGMYYQLRTAIENLHFRVMHEALQQGFVYETKPPLEGEDE